MDRVCGLDVHGAHIELSHPDFTTVSERFRLAIFQDEINSYESPQKTCLESTINYLKLKQERGTNRYFCFYNFIRLKTNL